MGDCETVKLPFGAGEGSIVEWTEDRPAPTSPKNESSQAPELSSRANFLAPPHGKNGRGLRGPATCGQTICNIRHQTVRQASLLQRGREMALSALGEWGTVENPQNVPQRATSQLKGQFRSWALHLLSPFRVPESAWPLDGETETWQPLVHLTL